MEKKILDVTCGGRSIWFDKHHPAALYCDKRDEEFVSVTPRATRTCAVHPDVLCDFTDLPFEDNSFPLVVWDPPHLTSCGDGWIQAKYGKLDENWPRMLHDGFRECMRVLKPACSSSNGRRRTSLPGRSGRPLGRRHCSGTRAARR